MADLTYRVEFPVRPEGWHAQDGGLIVTARAADAGDHGLPTPVGFAHLRCGPTASDFMAAGIDLSPDVPIDQDAMNAVARSRHRSIGVFLYDRGPLPGHAPTIDRADPVSSVRAVDARGVNVLLGGGITATAFRQGDVTAEDWLAVIGSFMATPL